MADKQTNPFFADQDEEEDRIENNFDTPQFAERGYENRNRLSADNTEDITIDAIAAKLLKDHFFLTALELHTELVELGRELPRFRDYFSNPSNFERTKSENTSPNLPRTSSIQTFDSLDFARYSDDGERQVDERVAVLEFELRKAQDTIKALRVSLTREADELTSPDQRHDDGYTEEVGEDRIRPLEKRAMNYLVNEYLLLHAYKLTSVTFSEENDDQDFEQWDEVGLNISKPPDLLHLYRDYGNHLAPQRDVRDVACEVRMEDDSLVLVQQQCDQLTIQMECLTMQLEELKLENIQLQAHNKTLLVMQDVSLRKSSTPLVTPIHTPSKHDPHSSQSNAANTDLGQQVTNQLTDNKHANEAYANQPEIFQPTNPCVDDENIHQSNESPELHRVKPSNQQPADPDVDQSLECKSLDSFEQPECDMNEKTNEKIKQKHIDDQTNEITQTSEKLKENEGLDKIDVNEDKHEQLPHNIDESMQVNTGSLIAEGDEDNCDLIDNRKPTSDFQRALMDMCFCVNFNNRIIAEVSKLCECDINEVVEMLTRCLPHIVPNVILAKREELIPLIVCAATLHSDAKKGDILFNIALKLIKLFELIPLIVCAATLHSDAKERDNLLNILFNLIKKPDEEQRNMILNGCVAFASHVGAARVEEELLPQCWEQINHKYTERRILVAEACGTLAPYIPSEMLSSLVMSMLQQMLKDDRDAGVRQAVVKSLSVIVGYITDPDKYAQGSNLLMLAHGDQSDMHFAHHPQYHFAHRGLRAQKGSDLLMVALRDQSDVVLHTAQDLLLPSFAIWSTQLGHLQHDLVNTILRRLEHLVKSALAVQQTSGSVNFPLDETQFICMVRALQGLLPFLLVSVMESGPYMDSLQETMDQNLSLISSRFPKPMSALTNPSLIVGNNNKLNAMVTLFERHMDQEWVEPWETFSWLANNLIPRCIEVIGSIDLSSPKLISVLSEFFVTLSQLFGRSFADKKVKARFRDVLNIPEEELDGQVLLGQTALTTCMVPVYAAGVLSAFNSNEDNNELSQFLQTAVCTLALCQAPLDSVKAAFVQLGTCGENHEMLLAVLWDGVMHTSAQVRSASSLLFDLIIKGLGDAQLSTKVVPALLIIKGLGDAQLSTRVVPALVTLANDPEITVRLSTVQGFGTLIEHVSTRETLDRIYMQLHSFLDDPHYRDQHNLHIELIRMFARVSPNAEPKFRDDYIEKHHM